ncbi:sulfatase [Candidatus Hydrogenedentota bacterium]
MRRPNIIYMHSHDTGRYVQPYGHAIPTPNIQKLAEDGVTFTCAFCCAPTCSASRASLLTGQVSHSCGQFGLVNRGFELRDREKHVAHTLKSAGYSAYQLGVHHVVRDPLTCGYDERLMVDLDDNGTNNVANRAEEFFADPPEGPFFLNIGFRDTHRTFPVAPEEDARYCMPPAPLPNTRETRQDMADFIAAARVLDGGIGSVLAALDESGLAENTLVICTTDHGIAFPKMKCNLTDHGTGVMLIIRGSGGFSGGKVCDGLVSQVDVFPTICDVAGIDHPDWLQGTSLLPLVNGETEEINGEIYAEVNYHAAYEPMRAVRTNRWKYIRRYMDYPHPVVAQIDSCPSKDLVCEHGYAKETVDKEELYDLIRDPNEAHNLANYPACSEALEDMRIRLDNWMIVSDDPLLDGPIPAPDGVVLSFSDEYDHWEAVKRFRARTKGPE